MFPWYFYKHYILLLQLENYELGRFFRVSLRTFWRIPRHHRQIIDWTRNLSGIVILANILYAIAFLVLIIVFGAFLTTTTAVVLGIITYFLFGIFYFVFLAIAVAILKPFRSYSYNRQIRKAKSKIKNHPHLIVIGIAGSYGKTTMKTFLETVLKERFKVLATDGNKNTPIGIARRVNKFLKPETNIFVMEMGEFVEGDIRALCAIARPDIAVVTGINEAHLDRMKNLETTTRTVFEVVKYAKKNALVVLNEDDERVEDNYEEYTGDRSVVWYSAKQDKKSKATYHPENKHFHEDGTGISFKIFEKGRDVAFVKLPFLADYTMGNVSAVYAIANSLGMKDGEINKALKRVRPAPHRLEVSSTAGDIIMIDDAYNGNPDGVREAIDVLEQFTERRKVYVTPGLVELGNKHKEIHIEIGEELAQVADVVVLVKNSATKHIEEGLKNQEFNEDNLYIFDTPGETYNSLREIVKAGDVVILQNDWPDNYL